MAAARPQKPLALLCDVNGTLFPVSAGCTAFRELGLPSSALEVWFARVLRDAFAAQLAGSYLPFKQFAAHHLGCLLRAHGASAGLSGEEAVGRVLSAWSAADLHPDAARGLRSIHQSGFQLAVLTNGSADSIARSVLGKAGLEGAFSHLLDIGMAGAWKPATRSYAWAAEEMGLAPEQVMLVASHPWDIHGAGQAGLQTAYVQRDSWDPYPPFLPHQPGLVARSFEELAEQLAAL